MNFLFLKLIFISYLVFGSLWLLYPKKMLQQNTEDVTYNNITIHMTQTFGLTLVLVSSSTYYAINTKNRNMAKYCLISYIIYSCILLILQYNANKQDNTLWNKKKHYCFGMLGLVFSIICCCMGLLL
jgi:hypothetical protein